MFLLQDRMLTCDAMGDLCSSHLKLVASRLFSSYVFFFFFFFFFFFSVFQEFIKRYDNYSQRASNVCQVQQ